MGSERRAGEAALLRLHGSSIHLSALSALLIVVAAGAWIAVVYRRKRYENNAPLLPFAVVVLRNASTSAEASTTFARPGS
jgi:hypothetical protein